MSIYYQFSLWQWIKIFLPHSLALISIIAHHDSTDQQLVVETGRAATRIWQLGKINKRSQKKKKSLPCKTNVTEESQSGARSHSKGALSTRNSCEAELLRAGLSNSSKLESVLELQVWIFSRVILICCHGAVSLASLFPLFRLFSLLPQSVSVLVFSCLTCPRLRSCRCGSWRAFTLLVGLLWSE